MRHATYLSLHFDFLPRRGAPVIPQGISLGSINTAINGPSRKKLRLVLKNSTRSEVLGSRSRPGGGAGQRLLQTVINMAQPIPGNEPKKHR